MADESEDKDLHHYSFTYALDRDGFFRRACPSCGREYKVRAAPEDLAYSLQLAFREVGPEIGENAVDEPEKTRSEKRVYCPYCGHCAQSSRALPERLWLYLRRWAMREVILPQLRQMASDLERSFRSYGTHSREMVSIGVTFKANDFSLPPRPIAGPEPPDMKRVRLLCCHGDIKVLDGWQDIVICPLCGTEAVLQ